ncbi:MAG: Rieske 2Fe-2S domain-containing protein [Terriglobia bacterium]
MLPGFTMSSAAVPIPQASGSEMLRGFWYPVLRSTHLRGRKLQTATLLGVPLVIGRNDQGHCFALHDCCPHRRMPLSFGRFDGGAVECPYHGWRFDTKTGRCREIPSLPPDSTLKVEHISAAHFPCGEEDGYVWTYLPDPARPDAAVPPVPRLPVFSPRYRLTHLSAELGVGVDEAIIHEMDPPHGPFVHQTWWWRSRRSIQLKEKVVEPISNGFRIRAHLPSLNSAPYKLLRIYRQPITTTIEFVLPSMRFEQIHCGPYWVSSRAMVSPITSGKCRFEVCAAWNIFPWVPFVAPILRFFGRKFLGQDLRNMEKQLVGLNRLPAMALVGDGDQLATWYFQLKAAYVEAKDSGQPMRHPIPGPVTLRYRS